MDVYQIHFRLFNGIPIKTSAEHSLINSHHGQMSQKPRERNPKLTAID